MNLPESMNAAILVKQDSELVVDKVFLPKSLDVGQVLVRLHVSGICGSQLGEIDGKKGIDPYLPHLMGHEGCGEVLKIGLGVKTVSVGNKVVLHWKKGSGIQSETPIYKWRGEKLNAGWVTTFNEYAIVSENRCTSISNDISNDDAALFGCAVTTAFGVVENNAKLRFGESVMVFGAGGIGLNILQASKLVSAWPIIAVDIFDNRLELARKFGATHTINSQKENLEVELNKIIKEKSLDVFIDNTGIPEIIEKGYDLTHGKGRVILVGVPPKNSNIKIYSLPLHFGKIILGSHGGECTPEFDIPRYMKLLRNKKINFKGLVTSRYKLHEINIAIRNMRTGSSSGRILIDL